MTTPTPISKPPAASSPLAADRLGMALPAGMPDPAALARLAAEFFAALPAASAVPSVALAVPAGAVSPPGFPNAVPAVAPALPSDPGLAGRAPSLAPAAVAPNSVPETAATAAPAAGGRAGGPLLGVPEAYAAALPAISSPLSATEAVPLPSTPYYFLGEASGYPAPAQGSAAPPRGDRVTALAFSLPGAEDLHALLATLEPALSSSLSSPESSATRTPSRESWFYFVDPSDKGASASGPVPASAHPPFDVHAVRRDFPILAERVNGRQLVWFDNAATTQKPQAVIDRLAYFYAHENSNIHRAAHELAARSTDAYEAARNKVARFLGASTAEEIIFVRGSTEAINLVAQSWGRANLGPGDEIVLSHLEHHANIVPWQQIASEKGAKIRVIPVDDSGQILLEEYRKLLNDRTKIVAVTQVSNALGTVVPVREIVQAAHAVGARALVDGAQSVAHMRVNVQALDADFFVFSGHKIFGPTGIGVVYGKREVLEQMPPYQGGGNMIQDVTFERTLYQHPPTRFEAGTGNIADAVGLGAALDYLERVGLENAARYEHDLLVYATRGLGTVPGLRLIGTAPDKASVLSFVLAGWKPEDVGRALNQEGIAVRAGHHCAQPILRRFGLEATVRASLAFYNTCEEIDCMIAALRRMAHQPQPG